MRLGEILLEKGLITSEDLEKALEYFGERAFERRHVADPLP